MLPTMFRDGRVRQRGSTLAIYLSLGVREVHGEFLTFAMCINVSSSGFTEDGLEAPSVP